MAKLFLEKMLSEHQIILKTYKDAEGKFGRILGDLYQSNDSISINQHLVNNHHAVIYNGQSKEQIQSLHLLNRKKL